MKNRIISPMAVVLVSFACLSGTEVEVQELQGNWIATHIAYANVNDDTDVEDLVPLVGEARWTSPHRAHSLLRSRIPMPVRRCVTAT